MKKVRSRLNERYFCTALEWFAPCARALGSFEIEHKSRCRGLIYVESLQNNNTKEETERDETLLN